MIVDLFDVAPLFIAWIVNGFRPISHHWNIKVVSAAPTISIKSFSLRLGG